MKILSCAIFIMLLLSSGCNVREREQEIQRKTIELNQREQELALKEKTLKIKEEELDKRENRLDSLDSSAINATPDTALTHLEINGSWSVKMNCTETTCAESAVGDTKTEKWEFETRDNNIIARAFANENLTRVYMGVYRGDTLQLSLPKEDNMSKGTSMNVTLLKTDKNKMEGRRQIIHPDNCLTTYALELVKL
jgi:hypothetical protein